MSPLPERRRHDRQTGKPGINLIGSDGWVGNTGWCGPLEASSKEILNSAGGHDDFLQCVRFRKNPYFPVDIDHRVSTFCHIAIKLGRKPKWDPASEQFGDSETPALMDRPRRNPWQLPKAP